MVTDMSQRIETKLAQIGNRSENVTGTVNPPVYFSTAYPRSPCSKSAMAFSTKSLVGFPVRI